MSSIPTIFVAEAVRMSNLISRSVMLSEAATLNDPDAVISHDDSGNEYVRGQAELIAYSTLTAAEVDNDMVQGGDLLARIYDAIRDPSPENIAKACEQPAE